MLIPYDVTGGECAAPTPAAKLDNCRLCGQPICNACVRAVPVAELGVGDGQSDHLLHLASSSSSSSSSSSAFSSSSSSAAAASSTSSSLISAVGGGMVVCAGPVCWSVVVPPAQPAPAAAQMVRLYATFRTERRHISAARACASVTGGGGGGGSGVRATPLPFSSSLSTLSSYSSASRNSSGSRSGGQSSGAEPSKHQTRVGTTAAPNSYRSVATLTKVRGRLGALRFKERSANAIVRDNLLRAILDYMKAMPKRY